MKYETPTEIIDLNYDIVVIGSGAAGTVLASKLANSNKKVLILEAGKNEWEYNSQKIYSGYTSGYLHDDIENVRIRQLGGSTNCWGGACLPFDPIDFELTENNRLLWPINHKILKQYYIEAGKFYGIGNYYKLNDPPKVFNTNISKLSQKYWLVNDNNKIFLDRYDKLVAGKKNIDLCLSANVIDVKFSAQNKIDSIVVEDYDNRVVTINAKKIVLAAGGLESTRLLLNWSERHTALNAIRKNLGLYYSPHINIRTGSLIAYPGKILNSDSISKGNQILATGFFSFDFKKSDQEKFLNSQWTLIRNDKLIKGKRFWKWPKQFINGISGKETELKKYLSSNSKDGELYDIVVAFDQTPTSKSLINLVDETDRFDLKKINVNFYIASEDIDRIKNTYMEVAKIFGEAGIGRANISGINEYLENNILGNSHHTGTIRMANSADYGCVDENLKIFGIENLWVCSSAVFPTPSQANPTFTIMALATRLSEELLK
ncbi:GMC oxidoreductase [Amylibacter sp.]|nr:GMC oxidoreductase [Amylibacter sp.]